MKGIQLLFLTACSAGVALHAQLPYTVKQYADRVEKNVIYGIDTAFDGSIDTLKLDLYTPAGDDNCRRPIVVVVHGGAWLGGDKAGGSIPAICREFTSRGYVAASINYRMGMHPASYYVPYALCVQEKCSYVADTSEWYRACFRAMQDLKSAVRFMKQRGAIDSTDHNNVFLLGESAGAFTSLLGGWMDNDGEKPAACYAIADAPLPDDDLKSCVAGTTSRKRPDLGSTDGKGNMGMYHAKVKGVAAFYGGVLDTSIFRQTDVADTPLLYLFHQTCDVIVDNNKGRLFNKVYQYCYDPVNLCMPFTSGPVSWGSTAIQSYIAGMGSAGPTVKYTLLTSGGAYSCNAGSNCHGIDQIALRMKEVADFFAPVIQASGNTPGMGNCYFAVKDMIEKHRYFHVYPNPSSGQLTISGIDTGQGNAITCILSGMEGKVLYSAKIDTENNTCKFKVPEQVNPGVYCLWVSNQYHSECLKLIIE